MTAHTGDSLVTSPWRLGSLCSGYGGLDLAVEAVLDVRPVWVCEYDPAPASILARRFPGVPNLHDLTILDWQQVPPVDVLTAGYPCQPFSQAGQRKGTDDERHLWPYIAEAVRVLRPRFVVLENVAGHLSLGFGDVLRDLATLGLHVEWTVVRASDVGGCHQRARLFVLAADTRGGEPERRGGSGQLGASSPGAEGAPRQRQRVRDAAVDRSADAADAHDGRRGERDPRQRRVPVAHEGDPTPADSDLCGVPGREPEQGRRSGRRAPVAGAGQDVHADAERLGLQGGDHADGSEGLGVPRGEPLGARPEVAWGDYEPAIRRHERALGRRAPSPVDDRGRLSPAFVEWMQMLPEGWVTRVEHLSRAQQLKILGNGVVPPQAAYAIRGLLARLEHEEVAA